MISAIVLAICLTVSAVSADDDWSFNFSSSEGSNSKEKICLFKMEN